MAFTSQAWNGGTYSIPGLGDTGWSGTFKVDGLLISLAANAVTLSTAQSVTNKAFSASTFSGTFTGTFNIATIINGAATLTLPTTTDTLVGRATTDILTGKTLAFASNTFTGALSSVNGGTGIANNVANTITFSGSFGLTLTLSNTTSVTLPTTGTLATLAGNETLTTKTMSGASNTFSNIPYTAVTGFSSSQVIGDSPNGHGSSSTKIRRWTNAATTGSDITYADSATLGGSLTIATAGIYSITYTDSISASTTVIGISLNTSAPTTNIQSIGVSERLSCVIVSTAGRGQVVIIGRFAVSDVLRFHTDGTPDQTGPSQQFRIVRLA